MSLSDVKKYPKRKRVCHGERVIYEWEQELEDVHLYISPPAGITASMLAVDISNTRITVAIKGNPPYLDVATAACSLTAAAAPLHRHRSPCLWCLLTGGARRPCGDERELLDAG
jgi:hypothetical protein